MGYRVHVNTNEMLTFLQCMPQWRLGLSFECISVTRLEQPYRLLLEKCLSMSSCAKGAINIGLQSFGLWSQGHVQVASSQLGYVPAG